MKNFHSAAIVNPKSALSYMDSLLGFIHLEKNDTVIGYLYDWTARAHYLAGNGPDSVVCYALKAQTIFENVKYYAGLSTVETLIGKMYQVNKDFEQTKRYFLKARETIKLSGQKVRMYQLLEDLGNLYTATEQYDSAIYFLKEKERLVKQYEKEQNKTVHKYSMYNAISRAYLSMGDSLNGLRYAQRVLEDGNITASSSLRNFSDAVKSLSIAYAQMGIVDSSMKYSKLYYEVAKDDVAIYTREQSRAILGEAYFMKREYKKSYELLAEAFGLRKERYEKLLATKSQENASKFENFRLSEQLSFAEQEKKQMGESSRRLKYFIGLLSAFVLGVLFLVYLLNKKSKKLSLQQSKLQELLSEREVLLREIHHRVKNNLQAISSILNLQQRRTSDEIGKMALTESSNRVRAIALMHQSFYENDSLEKVELNDYIQRLGDEILMSLHNNKNISLKVDVQKIRLKNKQMIPMGLLVNELLMNSIKHGMKNRDTLEILITGNLGPENYHLKLKDDGPGFRESHEKSNGLGVKLIASFVKQLKAEIKYFNDDGANIEIILPQIS